MAHKTRAARAANEVRQQACAARHAPVPAAEQALRATVRAAEQAARYPVAPVYADQLGRKPRRQPTGYASDADPFLAALIAMATLRRRKRAV